MISRIAFTNFKALRSATLPMERLTLLIGPNGSGKSTVLKGIEAVRDQGKIRNFRTLNVPGTEPVSIEVVFDSSHGTIGKRYSCVGTADRDEKWQFLSEAMEDNNNVRKAAQREIDLFIARARVFRFEPARIALPVIVPKGAAELNEDGSNLAGVLSVLREDHPDRFASVNQDVSRWLPEFESVGFYRPDNGQFAVKLRRRDGKGEVNADQLSDGTLFALAIITLANSAEPPSLVCVEEPDRGLHPRVLRDVCEGLHRLAFPEEYGDKRGAVQVLITSHSPYMLDFFRDHPERVVLVEKDSNQFSTEFKRLTDISHFHEILADAPLGDAWYSGVFGGVPTAP